MGSLQCCHLKQSNTLVDTQLTEQRGTSKLGQKDQQDFKLLLDTDNETFLIYEKILCMEAPEKMLSQIGYELNEEKLSLKLINDDDPSAIKDDEELSQPLKQCLDQYLADRKMRQLVLEDKISKDSCNIFISQDFYTNETNCILFISARDSSRAGQWSSDVCLKYGLVRGSMLSYIDYCNERQYSSIIFDPNCDKQKQLIQSQGMIDHTFSIWNYFIEQKCPAKSLLIISYEEGGKCVQELYNQKKAFFKERVKSVILIDSNLDLNSKQLDKWEKDFFTKKCIHYKSTRDSIKYGQKFKKQLGFIPEHFSGAFNSDMSPYVAQELVVDFATLRFK